MPLFKRIIPCLDVDKGRVVKGVQYVDHVDAGDPVEVAKRYDAQEADEITFLDITASHEGRGAILDVVARTADVCFMPLSVGGGIRSVEDARRKLEYELYYLRHYSSIGDLGIVLRTLTLLWRGAR